MAQYLEKKNNNNRENLKSKEVGPNLLSMPREKERSEWIGHGVDIYGAR